MRAMRIDGRGVLRALAAPVVLIAALAAPAPAATPTLAQAKKVAKTHVTKQFRIGGFSDVFAFRSKRQPAVALVVGYFARPRLMGAPRTWAVYLRARVGAWRVIYAGIGFGTSPPKQKVPCDIWPPFSEPSC